MAIGQVKKANLQEVPMEVSRVRFSAEMRRQALSLKDNISRDEPKRQRD